MTKVLVTGGAGFIGSNFVRYALHHHPDWHVVNLDKLTYAGNLKNLDDITSDPATASRYRFVQGDIADEACVDPLFAEERFDFALNFAAETHVDRSIGNPGDFIQTDVYGTYVLSRQPNNTVSHASSRSPRMRSMGASKTDPLPRSLLSTLEILTQPAKREPTGWRIRISPPMASM